MASSPAWSKYRVYITHYVYTYIIYIYTSRFNSVIYSRIVVDGTSTRNWVIFVRGWWPAASTVPLVQLNYFRKWHPTPSVFQVFIICPFHPEIPGRSNAWPSSLRKKNSEKQPVSCYGPTFHFRVLKMEPTSGELKILIPSDPKASVTNLESLVSMVQEIRSLVRQCIFLTQLD